MLLTASEILGLKDRSTTSVHVPEWKGTVTVRAMSGSERDTFETLISTQRKDGEINIRATLVALTLVNAEDQRVFSDDDIAALGRKSAAALDRIFTASCKLSGILSADVGDLEKNSAAPTGDGLS